MSQTRPSVVDFWWAKLPPVLQNKYLLTLLLFSIWLLFFDRNDVISQWKLQGTYNDLLEKRRFYKAQSLRAKKELKDLLTNDIDLENFAREKYRMKGANEEVFIIEKR
jgi:hypothetical protein